MNQLLKRTLSGALFLALMLAGLLLGEFTWLGLMSAIMACCFLEYYRLAVPGRFAAAKKCVAFAALAFLAVAFACVRFALPTKWLLLCLLPVLVAMVLMIFNCSKDYGFSAEVFFPLIYIAFPIVSSLFLVFPWGEGEYTPWVMLSLFAMIWLNDIGAYLIGMAFGQRENSAKLFPAISPKKSWVGVLGGTAFTFLAAWGVSALWSRSLVLSLAVPAYYWWILAAVVSVLGVLGDLFESLLKRQAQVKDSGSIIPGHGGILDRFDDVLFILPVAAAILKFII